MADIYGAKVSKPTIDVDTAGTSNLIWTSEANCLKIWQEGAGTLNASGSASIAHGLGFTPTYLVYAETVAGRSYGMYGSDRAATPLKAYTNSGSLVFTGNVANAPYYYYIFGDTANEQNTSTALSGTSSVGIRVSKVGKSVLSNIIEDQVLSSDFPPMKIYNQGTLTNTGGTVASIAHGLPFRPAFLSWAKRTTDPSWQIMPYVIVSGPSFYAYTTTTNLVLDIAVAADPGTFQFRYLIFGERGI